MCVCKARAPPSPRWETGVGAPPPTDGRPNAGKRQPPLAAPGGEAGGRKAAGDLEPDRARSQPPAIPTTPAAGNEAEVFGGREVTLATRQRPASATPPGSGSVSAGMFSRPSDRRGSGSEPEPPCAFKVSMFSVSCNSH